MEVRATCAAVHASGRRVRGGAGAVGLPGREDGGARLSSCADECWRRGSSGELIVVGGAWGVGGVRRPCYSTRRVASKRHQNKLNHGAQRLAPTTRND